MVRLVDVVDRQHVDAVQAKAQQAILVGSQHTVATVVGVACKLKPATLDLPAQSGPILGSTIQVTALGRENETVAGLGMQSMSEAVFALALAVLRRRVEIVDPCRIGSIHDRGCCRIVDRMKAFTEGRSAEPKAGDLDVGPAEGGFFQGIHWCTRLLKMDGHQLYIL